MLLVFATALGLLLAASNVYLRDIQYLVEVTLLFWFWMTPIVYPWTKVEDQLGRALPLAARHLPGQPDVRRGAGLPAGAVAGRSARRCTPRHARRAHGSIYIYGGNLYGRLGILFAVCLVLLWLAQRVFARAQGNFAQEL